jgi:hypothetical protein
MNVGSGLARATRSRFVCPQTYTRPHLHRDINPLRERSFREARGRVLIFARCKIREDSALAHCGCFELDMSDELPLAQAIAARPSRTIGGTNVGRGAIDSLKGSVS